MILWILFALTFSSITQMADSIADENLKLRKLMVNLKYPQKPRVVFYINSPSFRFSKDLFYYPTYRCPIEIVHKRFYSDLGVRVKGFSPIGDFDVSLGYAGYHDEFNIYSTDRRRSFNLLVEIQTKPFSDSRKNRIRKLEKEVELLELNLEKKDFIKSVQKEYMKLLYLEEIRKIYNVLYSRVKPITDVINAQIPDAATEEFLSLASFALEIETRFYSLESDVKKTGEKLKNLLRIEEIVVEDSFFVLPFPDSIVKLDWIVDSLKLELTRWKEIEELSPVYPELSVSMGVSVRGLGRTNIEAFKKISMRNLNVGIGFELPIPFSLRFREYAEKIYDYKIGFRKTEYIESQRELMDRGQVERLKELREKYGKVLKAGLEALKKKKISPLVFSRIYINLLHNYEKVMNSLYRYNISVIEAM